jgi:putative ABC transport system permease protein
MDIAQAQALLGARGELTQVDVVTDSGRTADVARSLTARLGPGVEVLRPEQREQRAEGLVRAFRLNLTALSLISLVVGFFLVHTTTQAALVRRRAEFGVLRATGATRLQLFGLILGEVALLGLLGVALGLPVGLAAARANLDVVSATLTNLYLLNAVERLDVPAWIVLLATGLGLLGAVVGAFGPALDVARAEVRDLLSPLSLHAGAGAAAGPLAAGGVSVLAATGAWYAVLGRDWQPAGFVWAVAILLAIPLVTPWLLARAAAPLRPVRFALAYSVKSLVTRLQTAAFAVASLAIAVSMLVGITVMVASFRETVAVWIGGTLQADIYVTTRSWRGTGAQGTLDSALVAALGRLDGVRAVDRLRGFPAYAGERRIALNGVDIALEGGAARFPLQSGELAAGLAALRDSGAVLITEPLARKAGLGVGDSLRLATPSGERAFRIAGVTYDYSSENGAAIMDLGTLAAAFGPGDLNSVALYLRPGHDPETVMDQVRARFPAAPLNLRSNRSLRAEVLRIFDQTFAVTRILQGMALLVAATGITLTLLILARERRSELALYRALGARKRQIFGFIVGKGLSIGVAGLLLGLAGGAALAAVLIYLINRAYFGWTIQATWPWGMLGSAALTIVVAAVAASVYPALAASRAPAAYLSRDDA